MRLRTAPTENDTTWKQDFKRPLVHDPRSALLHGVAGHAGLFSNVDDIVRVMQVLTAPEGNLVGGKPFIKPETVKLFTARASEKSSRALGWDTKLPEKCSCGDFFSPTSFGHTGFTGTSIWYDPVRKLCVVLLTNRVFPTSENNKIRAVRPAVHNAVVQALESR
jgi:CubicO group peptidase (beta-lactamase class C family)